MSSIRFLLDEHVPHAVAQALKQRGIIVLTPSDAGLFGASDEHYLARSRDEGLVVVTHDSDFLRLHRVQEHAGIAYCEQGARTIGQMVSTLVLLHDVLEPGDMVGRVEFL